MPNLRQTPRRPEYSRHLPTDSLLKASEAELASNNLDALRSNALKLAPTPVASSELHRIFATLDVERRTPSSSASKF
ncbi:unnamed protein product [Peronospora farinosa]|uniref:Uncharacterized protein n=1 Tax=Peronospora farinosa TaxID=134698 RepID=A0ABN8BY14_9STRA|nr:unnamed protein product [Peronospora farinosa]